MSFRLIGAVAALATFVLIAPASAQVPAPAAQGLVVAQADGAKPARRSRAKSSAAKKEPTAGQLAARERQRKCAAEWKVAKAGGKVADGMKWPKFWSQCNARLKGNSA